MATQISVTRNTVQSRMRRLEQLGVILAYRPLLDLGAAGIAVEAFIRVEIDQPGMDEVVANLRRLPEVLEVCVITGSDDLSLRVAAVDQEHLSRFVEKLVTIPQVRRTQTSLILSTPLPYRTEPILMTVTAEAGFGRSTPFPDS
jgi:DNA-binding Lrp family transcriptional regulator